MAGVMTSPAIPWGHWKLRRRLGPLGPTVWQRLVVAPLLAAQRQDAAVRQQFGAPGGVSAGGAGGDAAAVPRTKEQILAADGPVQLQWLVEDHSEAIYRVALSVTRDPSLAEDAAQEALLKGWQALPNFRGEAPIRNWILRIAHNTSISMLRRRREDLREPDELPELRTSGSTVESSAVDRMSIEAFEEALGSLDELSRSIVVLRELESLSYDEIAEVLEIPLPTVKTRLLRSRKILSNALEGWKP